MSEEGGVPQQLYDEAASLLLSVELEECDAQEVTAWADGWLHTLPRMENSVSSHLSDLSLRASEAEMLATLEHLAKEGQFDPRPALRLLLTSGAAGNKEKFSVQNVKYSFSPL